MILPLLFMLAMQSPVVAAPAASDAAKPVTPGSVVAGAPASAWVDVPADRVLVMELTGGRRVTIALSPDFAGPHVANIVALARAHWWDGTSINRVQDNYVTQWGDATEAKPLPPGIKAPVRDYDRPAAGLAFRAMPYRDSYAAAVGHVGGWAVAEDAGRAWLPHCYGMVGVGRNPAPDTGTGAELYVAVGHSPRQLDRNIAVVGRVLSGMEVMAALPRGTGDLGFYTDPAQRTGIVRVRLMSELPTGERQVWQVMDSRSPTFADWIRVKANRKDDFYERPAAGLDICNALPPVRVRP
ncbi:peptidylprolyl isomerase [Sphingomonas prati]|uniref:peptidylprolyl isomerase n=1 Tax=Sphingomonas prati TaxID=1843237 RepID=A0A7W9F0J5_9SPHN|nr:peptidylprolyl isomerase [Sphingomonas prati]MBB5728298.1 peptidylprolyl isomerase [Sphingomonas prati]GGE74930.1 peptidyl-prolyl cis-trans isomerase [Sphingomonas prati]